MSDRAPGMQCAQKFLRDGAVFPRCRALPCRPAFPTAQVSMNEMMEMVMGFEGMKKGIKHIPGPEGVRGRNSDNKLILEKLGWEPTIKLQAGGGGPCPRPPELLTGTARSSKLSCLPGWPALKAGLPGLAAPGCPHICRAGLCAGRAARDVPLDQGRAGEGGQGAGQGHQVGPAAVCPQVPALGLRAAAPPACHLAAYARDAAWRPLP